MVRLEVTCGLVLFEIAQVTQGSVQYFKLKCRMKYIQTIGNIVMISLSVVITDVRL